MRPAVSFITVIRQNAVFFGCSVTYCLWILALLFAPSFIQIISSELLDPACLQLLSIFVIALAMVVKKLLPPFRFQGAQAYVLVSFFLFFGLVGIVLFSFGNNNVFSFSTWLIKLFVATALITSSIVVGGIVIKDMMQPKCIGCRLEINSAIIATASLILFVVALGSIKLLKILLFFAPLALLIELLVSKELVNGFRNSTKKRKTQSVRPMIYFFTISVIFGVALWWANENTRTTGAPINASSMMLLGMAGASLLVFVVNKRMSTARLLILLDKSTLPLLSFSLIFISFFTLNALALSCFLIAFGSVCASCFFYEVDKLYFSDESSKIPSVVSVVQWSGFAGGGMLAIELDQLWSSTLAISANSLFATILLMVFISARSVIFSHFDAVMLVREEHTHTQAEELEACCVDIAVKHELTPREAEIFLMLAKGRSGPYIQDYLILSQGTVKTHIHRIYSKIGISNRQELIDLVERMAS